ncbi:MAG: dihydrolipoyllysine-residue acetyltransferase [Halioglobus sp.]|nr:dihydrolipoyllysine-residue acetyltransferase [Halioglobus sp.]
MTKQQVEVPDIGGAEGAEVIELLVAVGDTVAVDQSLIVLESDKASMEIPSTAAGTVRELLVAVGDELAEGAPIALIETDGAESDSPAAAAAAEPEGAHDARADTPSAAEPEPEPESRDSGSADRAAERDDSRADRHEQTVVVPDIGSDEAVDLIEVCVRVGDTVAEGDSLVVLESDKASMEVPAPGAGEVLEVLVAEGDHVRQGDALIRLRATGAAPATDQSDSASRAAVSTGAVSTGAESTAAESTAVSAADADTAVREKSAPSASRAAPPSPAPSGRSPQAAAGSGVYAGPAVRKLAREFGVPLDAVEGSGPRSRILKEDLQAYVRRSLHAPAAAGGGIPAIAEIDFSKFGEVEVAARSKLDKLTAANMQRSWLNVPHVTQFDEADITELEVFRKSLGDEAEQRGVKLTPMPFLLKACAAALRDNPKFNSSLARGGEDLVYKKYIHIGMAVDTPAGLVVPVLRDVDRKSIWELAAQVMELAERARERKLAPADMQGGCFTVSSLGSIGGNGFSPIINAPEVGILGVSRAAVKPVWDGQSFVPRNMLPLALSYDHRVINGGDGGRFFTRLLALLGDIRQLLM